MQKKRKRQKDRRGEREEATDGPGQTVRHWNTVGGDSGLRWMEKKTTAERQDNFLIFQ